MLRTVAGRPQRVPRQHLAALAASIGTRVDSPRGFSTTWNPYMRMSAAHAVPCVRAAAAGAQPACVQARSMSTRGARSATSLQEVEDVDLYKVLGLTKSATMAEIKARYRELGAWARGGCSVPHERDRL